MPATYTVPVEHRKTKKDAMAWVKKYLKSLWGKKPWGYNYQINPNEEIEKTDI
jgi:hypothetical protein